MIEAPEQTPPAPGRQKAEPARAGGVSLRGAPRRLAMAALPAAAVTFGLFLVMDAAIDTELTEAAPMRSIELVRITPADEIEAPRRETRAPVKRIDVAAPPPLPPAPAARKGDIDMPAIAITGAAPDLPVFERIGQLVPPVPAISAREAQPLRAPVPSYPDALARRGIEGECEVALKIDGRGQPFDILARCSHSGFERAAERAVADVQFAPRIVRGQPVEQHGVVYPIRFRLEE